MNPYSILTNSIRKRNTHSHNAGFRDTGVRVQGVPKGSYVSFGVVVTVFW